MNFILFLSFINEAFEHKLRLKYDVMAYSILGQMLNFILSVLWIDLNFFFFFKYVEQNKTKQKKQFKVDTAYNIMIDMNEKYVFVYAIKVIVFIDFQNHKI